MKKSIITLNPKYITFQAKYYMETIKVGMPSLFRQGLASIATIMLNNQAGNFGGDEALSGMSIVSKIFMILFSIALGIGQGYQPVCGYNYASKNYKRVRESMMFTLVSCTLVMTMTGIIIFILSNPLIRAFIGEDVENVEEVVKIGGTALRFQCLAMPFMGINLVSNMTFQSTRKKFLATLLSSCRQGLFFIPTVLILPLCVGILGVELTQPLSDVLTCLFTIPFFVKFLKDLKELEHNGSVKSNGTLWGSKN
jgi:Na+-driven multidrug efflux pump